MSQRHIHTHVTNKDCHPGIPDMPALRQSSEMVQKDAAASKAAALEAEARKQQNIWHVAEIENELHERSVQRQASFAKPTSKITCKPKLTWAPTVLNTAATPRNESEAQDRAHMVANGKHMRPRWTLANHLVVSDSETEEEDSLCIVDSIGMTEAEEVFNHDNHRLVGANQALPRKSAKKGKAVHSDIKTARKQLATKNAANVAHNRVSLKRKGEDVDVR